MLHYFIIAASPYAFITATPFSRHIAMITPPAAIRRAIDAISHCRRLMLPFQPLLIRHYADAISPYELPALAIIAIIFFADCLHYD